MKIIESEAKPSVFIRHDKLIIQVKQDNKKAKRQILLQEWYREELKAIIPIYIDKWEKIMGVEVSEFGIKKMKTKWGTCNIEAKRIWINLELAKKPTHCLEYIVAHELIHLLERHHSDRFLAYLDKYIPKWKFNKEELNRLPVSHGEWTY